MENFADINAVILAGGFGTRLQSVVSDKPKVLAEVSGRPFLTYLLDQIASAGIRQVVICVGYMAEKIRDCLGETYGPLSISYSYEDEPLGTGGALRLALPHVSSDTVLVMNGDSYIDVHLSAYASWFFPKNGRAALLLTRVPDAARYGRVILNENEGIVAFKEKQEDSGTGWINAGVYLIKRSLIASIPMGMPYSLEREFFPSLAGKDLFGCRTEGRFIDIGTPESYAETKTFFCGEKH
ncbi:nucleotidyltransferase family protein [Planctomycetota bacterium]